MAPSWVQPCRRFDHRNLAAGAGANFAGSGRTMEPTMINHPDPGDPAIPALPAGNRLPRAPYHQVLTGQPALVTGANSGVGRAVALGLARAGADVAINYVTRRETTDEVVREIEGMGRKAIAIQADVSQEEDVEQMFAEAVAHFGTLHVVVSNAGMQQDSAFDEMTLEQWNAVISINLTGQFLCTRAATRAFKRRGVISAVSNGVSDSIRV